MEKIGKIILFIGLLSCRVFAVEVEALIQSDQVGQKTPFDYTIMVQSDSDVEVSNPKVIAPEGLTLLSENPARASSKSSSMVQGQGGVEFKTTYIYEFHYQFRADKMGKYIIPPYPINVGKENLKTKALTVSVIEKAPPSSAVQNQNPLDDDEDEFEQLLQHRGFPGGRGMRAPPQLSDTEMKQLFFVKLETDKDKVYEGEQIIANWSLYLRGGLASFDQVKVPDVTGFWKEVIEQATSFQFTQEVINGIPYRKALLLSEAIFPLKSGTATIDEYKVKATVTSGSPFGQALTYERSSDRKEIQVMPLPAAGRPESFTGAVGSFEVRAEVDQKSPRVDQPFSLKVRFEGTGNAKAIDLPPLTFPDGLEKFDVKSSSNFEKTGKSSKDFEILLIPRRAGKYELPAMSFGFFDPQTKAYAIRTTAALTVEVAPGNVGAPSSDIKAADGGSSKSDEASAPRSPLVMQLSSHRFAEAMAWPFLAILDLLALIALGIYAILKWPRIQREPHGEEILKRTKKLADASVKKNHFREAANIVLNGIQAFFHDVLKVSPSSIQIQKALALLPPDRRERATNEYLERQTYFEKLAFSPEKDSTELQNIQMFQKNLQSMLSICEDVLKKVQL